MISGVFFGVAFGIGGLGAAVLGRPPITPASHSCIMSAPSCGARVLAVFLPRCPNTRAERTSMAFSSEVDTVRVKKMRQTKEQSVRAASSDFRQENINKAIAGFAS